MNFNPEKATAAYIDSLGPAALAKAEAYTTGTHWLLLWSLGVIALISWIIIRLKILDWVSERLSARSWAVRTFTVAFVFMLISALMALPWSIYSDWWRPSFYGRTSQPVGDFLGQSLLALVINGLLFALFLLGIYALIKRTGTRWWLWSGGLAALSISLMLLVAPIVFDPLFNDFKPVPQGPVRDALVKMADEAKIPHDKILMFDGSRQSNNFTANVSGVMGSARIAISDVALTKASLGEVKAVTGHEIGHYVLGHVWRSVGILSSLAVVLFFLADRLFPRIARAFKSNTTIGDPLGLPVLMVILTILSLVALPVVNTLTRMSESEADAYSLRTVNLPDSLASGLVKTAEYRYPRPSAWQEFIFYSHPSVERRVRAAMEWKAAHPPALAKPQ